MNPTLDSFLHHGHLPFVGRAPELERIEALWRSTAETAGLQILVLTGEAGAGKSRLVEEVALRIVRQRGLVIQTKLYPASTTALAPLLARAIDRAAGATSLVRTQPEPTLPSVAATIRRLARVRRTLLIIEDIHLMPRDAMQDLAMLLESVATDSVALLCTARPETIAARPVLERFAVDEMRVGALDRGGLETLWSEVFHGRLNDPALVPLIETTMGNMLAIRSALRGALKRGIFASDGGTWRSTVAVPQLERSFAESVRTLSEGMAVHLGDAERDAARSLASLGEVFARNTAARLVGVGLIDALVTKGILTRNAAGTMLPPPAADPSAALLAFSHTLVHRFFLDGAPVPPGPIVEAIADDAPLCSTLAFERIAASTQLEAVAADALERACDRTLRMATQLNQSNDWDLAPTLVRAADRMLDACHARLDAARARALEIDALSTRVSIHARTAGPEYDAARMRMLALTEHPRDTAGRCERLRALMHEQNWALRNAPERWHAIDAEAEAMVAGDSACAGSLAYVGYLRAAMAAARSADSIENMRSVERRYARIITDESLPEPVRERARIDTGALLVDLFESEAELDERLARFAEITEHADADVDVPKMLMHRAIALYEAGRIEGAWDAIDEILPQFEHRGLRRTVVQCRMIRCCVRALRREPDEAIESEIDAIVAGEPAAFLPMIATSVTQHVAMAAHLAGNVELARRLLARFAPPPHGAHSTAMLDAMLTLADAGSIEPQSIEGLVGELKPSILDPATPAADAVAAFRRELARRPYRLESVASMHLIALIIDAYERAFPRRGAKDALLGDLRSQMLRCLAWLEGRGLWCPAEALIRRHRELLRGAERMKHERAISARRAAPAAKPLATGGDRVRVTMLGTIRVTRPQAGPIRPKGARVRALLGVLSANAMLERPLSNREFYTLAAGERDLDRARRSVYVAVHRLREMLGVAAIVTDGETPRFDPRVVHVDVVEASVLLHDAHDAARDDAWLRASTSLLAALDITRGDVPFPGLYDDFFEAAREDFEGLLRATAVRVARGLMIEGDPETACDVLERALTAMPEDDTLGDLLCETLIALGRRTEAERLIRERTTDDGTTGRRD